MGQNPDGLTTHWQRIAGSWLPYYEGAVRNITPGSALGQRDRAMLDLCQAVLELTDRLKRLETGPLGTASATKDEVNRLKESVRLMNGSVAKLMAKG